MRADRAARRMAAAIARADLDDAVRHARRWCVALDVDAADVAAVLDLATAQEVAP